MLNYHVLFSCFNYIPLILEHCYNFIVEQTDIKTLLQSRRI